MATRSKQEIKRTAWHEAGHVGHRLGAMEDFHRLMAAERPSFIGVWIKRDEADKAPPSHRGMEQTSNGLMFQDETEYVYTHKGMMVSNLLAGIAGERLMTKRTKIGRITYKDWFSGSQGDLISAFADTKAMGFDDSDAEKRLDCFLEDAWEVLKENRCRVEAIANALIERGYLSYDECVAIWEAINV